MHLRMSTTTAASTTPSLCLCSSVCCRLCTSTSHSTGTTGVRFAYRPIYHLTPSQIHLKTTVQIDDGKSGDPVYLNKRTGEVTSVKPPNFSAERKEIRTFQYVTLDDGTEVTTYVDSDGRRLYLNWDDQVCSLRCVYSLNLLIFDFFFSQLIL